MGLQLHQKYTIAKAVAAFGPADAVEFLFDRQVAVVENAALCMLTIGDAATYSHLFGRVARGLEARCPRASAA